MNQDNLVRINFASLEELQTLNQIGPLLAQRILDYRVSNGFFRGPEDLANISGISINRAQSLSRHIDWDIPTSNRDEIRFDHPETNLIEPNRRRRLFQRLSNLLTLISIILGVLLAFTFYLVLTEKNIISVSTKRKGSEPPYSIKIQTNIIPSADGFHESLEFEIDFEENLDVLSKELGARCINSLHVELLSQDNKQASRSQAASFPLSSPCSNENTAYSDMDVSNISPHFQFVDDKGYWYGNYPFELHEVTVNFWIEASLPNGESVYVDSGDMEVNIDIPNWSVKAELQDIEANLNGADEKATQLKLRIQRPLGVRLLSIVLLLGLFCFIMLLAFIPETGSALEVSVGILLGLWGIQNILIPPNIRNQTPIHEAIIFLYLFFGWIAFIRFVLIPLRKKVNESD